MVIAPARARQQGYGRLTVGLPPPGSVRLD